MGIVKVSLSLTVFRIDVIPMQIGSAILSRTRGAEVPEAQQR
jgi:hypothetical protein